VPTPAQAEFIRGPYDGLVIDVDQVERFLGDDAVRESFDNRLFLLMPPLLDWDRIVEGKADRDGPFDQSSPYEVAIRPGRLEFVYCGLARFQEAMEGQEGDA
jgi:hypothetical protein